MRADAVKADAEDATRDAISTQAHVRRDRVTRNPLRRQLPRRMRLPSRPLREVQTDVNA